MLNIVFYNVFIECKRNNAANGLIRRKEVFAHSPGFSICLAE